MLPSLNVVFDLAPDLLLRFSAAKVMSRAELGNLTPSVAVTATTQNATVNNPLLEPIRAKTADLALEWYYAEGSLLSAAFFYKDIETFIQRITGLEPFRNLGVPDSVLAGSPSSPTDNFNVSRLQNTEGGPLKGIELNAQVQFNNLPGFWSNTGFLANYTKVESEIQYVLASVGGVPTVTTTNDLIDLSRNTASGTLFYDDGTLQHPHDGFLPRQIHPRHPGLGGKRRPVEQGESVRRSVVLVERERQSGPHLRDPEPDERAQHAVHRQSA